jgi:hypothetical protein
VPSSGAISAASGGVLGPAQCFVYGYGKVADVPDRGSYPALQVLLPGDRIPLPCSATVVQPGQAGLINGLDRALEASAAATGLLHHLQGSVVTDQATKERDEVTASHV